MRRLAAPVLFSFVAALPRLAAAQAPSPLDTPSCETVTTVRCTGSAAPLALPHPPVVAPPVVAPPVVEAPPPHVPQPLPQLDDEPPPCCNQVAPPPPPPDYGARPNLGSGGLAGWKLAFDENGRPVLERNKRTPIAAVWVPGLVLWISSYIGTAAGGAMNGHTEAAIPMFGGITTSFTSLFDDRASLGASVGYAIGSVLQVGGLVMFIAGAVGGKKVERMPVQISPYGLAGGGGLAAAGHF